MDLGPEGRRRPTRIESVTNGEYGAARDCAMMPIH